MYFICILQEGGIEISEAILEERAKTVEDWHRNAAARARYMKPAAPITCATFAQDVLEGRAKVSQPHDHKHQQPLLFGPASLVGPGGGTSHRERIAAQVFQPGHRYHHHHNCNDCNYQFYFILYQYIELIDG